MSPARRLPEFLRPAESRSLLRAATDPRDALLLLCGLGAGLRVAEITHLRIEDVDLAGGTIFVRQGKGAKDRYIPCPAFLLQALAAWIGERQTGWVFPGRKAGKPLTTRAVEYIVERLKEDAELVRRVHPHCLRHSYATGLLNAGADIMQVRDLLGHSSVATTQVYLSVCSDRLRATVDRLELPGAK